MKTSLIVLSVLSLISSPLWALTEATSNEIQSAKIACNGNTSCKNKKTQLENDVSQIKNNRLDD